MGTSRAGNVNQAALATPLKFTIPKQQDKIYPHIIPNKIDTKLVNPLKNIWKQSVTTSVKMATKK